VAKQANLPKSGDTGTPPEPAALSLPSLGDIKEMMGKIDKVLEFLSKILAIWEQVDPNRAMQPQKGDGAPVIPNPPSNGRVHLEANDGVITWAGFP
jgi:hypothetical protein